MTCDNHAVYRSITCL